jgi:hypothetical protein
MRGPSLLTTLLPRIVWITPAPFPTRSTTGEETSGSVRLIVHD